MNRIIPGLIWLILWILSWLPGFIMNFLSSLIHTLLFDIFRYRAEVIKTNISRSFPELTEYEQDIIAKKFSRHLSELFIEMIISARLRPKKTFRQIHFSNPEMIDRAYEQKQNIIILTGHYGNFEWNALPFLEAGYRVIGVYKPQSSKQISQLLLNIRLKPGISLIPMKDSMRVIARELKETTIPFALILIADQIPSRGEIRFWTMFLNQETAFFTGGEKLARRYGLPIFYVDQIKRKLAKYEVSITPVYDGMSPTEEGAITTAYARLLEATIRKNPYLWLWSHRRWKYRKEELPLKA
ncbi:MAG: lysophospholipid acyltransferase family protein [Bacteroidia bacterium]|nr:lysophospholipid acyltransferase family protein [Bacteroidia bacterium]